jgi:hypothetical protein
VSDELNVPCQEPERSGLVDGDAWWPVLDRAEQAEARVVKLERALRDVRSILDAYSDDDGPGASLIALWKIGERVYREVTGV